MRRTRHAAVAVNSRRTTRVEGRAMAWRIALVALLVGCECTVEDLDRWVYEDWEGCSGLCGWEVVEGDARIVETYHSAEHALQFAGARAVVRLALDPGTRTCTEYDCDMQLGAVTSCWDPAVGTGAPRLGAQIVYRDPAGTDVPRAVALECTSAGGTLRFCQGNFELGLPDPGGGAAWPPTALILESTMDGCVVDDVVLEDFWIFCGA